MTTVINGTSTSASAPAVVGDDSNSGVYFPAADTVGIATAGTERLRVNSSGNVTVGKTDISTTVDGFAVLNSGETRISCSANDVLNLNRNSSNGAIQRFFRSGSLVGQIEGSTTGLTYTGINGLTFTGTQTASADPNTLDDYEEGTWTPTSPVSLTVSTATYQKIGRFVFINTFIDVSSNSSSSPFVIGGQPFAIDSGSASVGCFNNDGLDLYAYMDSTGVNIRNNTNNTRACSDVSGNFVAFQMFYRTSS